jgi:hypothetical protein
VHLRSIGGPDSDLLVKQQTISVLHVRRQKRLVDNGDADPAPGDPALVQRADAQPRIRAERRDPLHAELIRESLARRPHAAGVEGRMKQIVQ